MDVHPRRCVMSLGALFFAASCGPPTVGGPSVHVNGGSFTMGCDASTAAPCRALEMPSHVVVVSDFDIDRTEVTQADYKACVDAGVCALPSGDWDPDHRGTHPVRFVDWQYADAYCKWKAQRLPTEAEWEKAARGSDARTFPWGEAMPDCSTANFVLCPSSVNDTDPVGTHRGGASPSGALDMAGSANEWVSDWFDPNYYQSSPMMDPQGPSTGTEHFGRGGCFLSASDTLATFARITAGTAGVCGFGFRCVSGP